MPAAGTNKCDCACFLACNRRGGCPRRAPPHGQEPTSRVEPPAARARSRPARIAHRSNADATPTKHARAYAIPCAPECTGACAVLRAAPRRRPSGGVSMAPVRRCGGRSIPRPMVERGTTCPDARGPSRGHSDMHGRGWAVGADDSGHGECMSPWPVGAVPRLAPRWRRPRRSCAGRRRSG